jgi:hypothetical protein
VLAAGVAVDLTRKRALWDPDEFKLGHDPEGRPGFRFADRWQLTQVPDSYLEVPITQAAVAREENEHNYAHPELRDQLPPEKPPGSTWAA